MGGSQLWMENDDLDIITDILQPNGIVLKTPPRILDGKVVLCEVDTEKTQMDDFYHWDEVGITDNETFCWRTLYTMGAQQKEQDWLSIPCIETIGSYTCKELCDLIFNHQSHLNDHHV